MARNSAAQAPAKTLNAPTGAKTIRCAIYSGGRASGSVAIQFSATTSTPKAAGSLLIPSKRSRSVRSSDCT